MAKKQVPSAPRSEQVQVNFRTNPKLLESVRQFAAWHGDRTLGREIEAALEVHVSRSMLAALEWPSFVEELLQERPDLDVDGFRAEVEAQLKTLEGQAVSRPDRLVELLP